MANPKPQSKFKVIKNKDGKVDLDETLFQSRNVFLNDKVDFDLVDFLKVQLLILDKISHDPIHLHISSNGGSVVAGFALIDFINTLKSKVIAIGSGYVASMATIIYLSCPYRTSYKSTNFMLHDMASGMADYHNKMKAQMNYQDKLWLKLVNQIKTHTKLTDKEIEYSQNAELWLFADEALKKGLVDKIIE